MIDDEKIIDLKQKVKARKASEEKTLPPAAPEDPITSAFVRDCLHANERGDGVLFTALHRGEFIFNKTSGCWFVWDGHHWSLDVMEAAYKSVEAIALKYLIEADRLANADGKGNKNTIEGYMTRARRLRSISGAQNCLSWAHRVEDALAFRGEDADRRPWLLACKNGVVELRSGRFRPGRPEDLLVKAAPHDWTDIDTPAPIWEKFLADVFDSKDEIINYVRRLFGYGITGHTTEHILPILLGEGRNGKGTLVETLNYVLGPLAGPIQSEMLLEQKSARLSAGPSPDIMSLKGLRLAFASETDEGRRFSTSKAKWLSGGDTLTGRNPHDKYETSFEPTHLLCLLTNHLPHAPADDYAFWSRVQLVPFTLKFVDKPAAENERPNVKDLREKLKAEASGILAWLVRGCIEWQCDGLNPPRAVLAATEKARANEDDIAAFIEAAFEDKEKTPEDAREKFKNVYDAFSEWYKKTIGDYPFKKKKFGQLMEKRCKKENKGGHVWFVGVLLKPEACVNEA